ncbi:DUF551 domain-containing protein [Salmonella enterica]|nr:DUF551 domain-containing protein [Salmonella enterica]
MKENQIRKLVNDLRDIAVEYHGTQQLRERIARTVRAAIIQAGNSPVIPDGWVMVPKVVTAEIGNAINEVGQRCTCGNCSQRLWDLLLAAAPKPQNAPQNIPENIPAGKSTLTPDGWISCSERMPEDEQEVIVHNKLGYRYVSYFDEHSGLFFDMRGGNQMNCIEHILVTHWMPLPAPPQQ